MASPTTLFTVLLLGLGIVIVEHSALGKTVKNEPGKTGKSGPQPQPHIIFILADDLGWNDVSFHGSYQIPTPNLDKLAYSGVLMSNYYVQPICTPTRSTLMTGKYPIHTGMWHNVISASAPWGLGLNETLLPELLQQQGYKTHMVGKWHMGYFSEEYIPSRRGFDSTYGYYNGKGDYWTHYDEEKYGGIDFHKNGSTFKPTFGQYSTNLFTSQAEDVIAKHDKSKPLFLYFAHQAVHSANADDPLQAPKEYYDRFPNITDENRRMFAAMVAVMDESVGNVTRALERAGLYDDAVIFFSTDNGGPAHGFDYNHANNYPLRGTKLTLWEGGVRGTAMVAVMDESIGNVTSALERAGLYENSVIFFSTDNGGPAHGFDMNHANNYPLRGIKHTLWEGGVRATGFVHSNLLKKPGRISHDLLHVSDWLPTIYGLAGGDVSTLKDLDGYDIWPTLSEGDESPRSEILLNIDTISNVSALRMGDMKIINGDVRGGRWEGWYEPEGLPPHYKPPPPPPGAFAVQCPPKPSNASTNCNPFKATCLYDLRNDPCEFYNIADWNQDIVAAMTRRLDEYKQTMVPARNTNSDPQANPALHGGFWVPWIKSADVND